MFFVLSSVSRSFMKFLAVFALCILLSVASRVAFAAEVVVSPSTGTYTKGQSFTTTIQVNPQGKTVNAVEAKLTFDNTKFAVVSVSKTGSVFSLWTTEPTFSNTAGTIDFGGGSPTPFSARSNLVSVTFRTLAEGSGTVGVSTASVLAADGLGTNVYTGAVKGTFTISAATTPTPTPPPEEEEVTPTPPPEEEEDGNAAITFGDPPRAPEAGSTTFLDPDTWYATKNGLFTWETPFDVDELALDISTSSDFNPVTKFDPPIDEFALNDTLLIDGIQYLTIQYKNQVGWGAILHRKLMIDTVPPEKFAINVRAGNSATAFPLLTFEAKDAISGIKGYEMVIADGEPIEVTPDEAKLGYLLTNLEDGTYTIRVTAIDLAGNKTESSVPVLITAGWTPPLEVVVETSFWDLFKGKNLVIILLLITIIGLIAYIVMLRKAQEHKEQKLRKETKEIQDQMEKIFSALRDEIYDQINMITKRERLSKKERDAVEGLNQALEVSETLIEKEITDVSKILK
jgi:Cohesin domain